MESFREQPVAIWGGQREEKCEVHRMAGEEKCDRYRTTGKEKWAGSQTLEQQHRLQPRSSFRRRMLLTWPLLIACVCWLALGFLVASPEADHASVASIQSLAVRASASASALLECFQVSVPVKFPTDAACTQSLMMHSFANSYGNPYIGTWSRWCATVVYDIAYMRSHTGKLYL